jgi:hypothetical protein
MLSPVFDISVRSLSGFMAEENTIQLDSVSRHVIEDRDRDFERHHPVVPPVDQQDGRLDTRGDRACWRASVSRHGRSSSRHRWGRVAILLSQPPQTRERRQVMALEDTLRGIREASAKRIPPDRAAIMHRATEELRASGIMERVIKVDDTLPSFELPNAYGQQVRSADLLAKGPLVLTFFRGAW